MSPHRALIVEDNPETIDMIVDVLASLEHEYDTACSQDEALRRLKASEYSYVLLDIEIPARSRTGPARIQNAENFLEAFRRFKDADMPPVIVLLPPEERYPDMTREEAVRLAHGLMLRGATDFIAKPFATAGRTLDRVIKKVMGLFDENHVLGRTVSKTCARSKNADDGETSDWLTVTQAAELLLRDLPGLDLARARSRTSVAAGRDEFKHSGSRRDRRIEPVSFDAWRLQQRDRDLDQEDCDNAA